MSAGMLLKPSVSLTSRNFSGDIKSFCIFNKDTFPVLRLGIYFAVSFARNILKEQIIDIIRSRIAFRARETALACRKIACFVSR